MSPVLKNVTVGVLALQGGYYEHLCKLKFNSQKIPESYRISWLFITVRQPSELRQCDALIIPGGESTTISLLAASSQLLEPLRKFVKVLRKPTWGTCAGLILLAESANRTKQGGQELIGGLDIKINRNHFGRQTESFMAEIDLPFLYGIPCLVGREPKPYPFPGIFIRAPVVEGLLPAAKCEQCVEAQKAETVVAPPRTVSSNVAKETLNQPVEILARLPPPGIHVFNKSNFPASYEHRGDIIAVKQGNVFGTSFHPELAQDERVHFWWLVQVADVYGRKHPCPCTRHKGTEFSLSSETAPYTKWT